MRDTREQRQNIAADELAQKLRLERPLAVQVRQILRQMSRDLQAVYAATGQVIDAGEYTDDFIGVLRPVYRKSARTFGNSISDDIQDEMDRDDSLLIGGLSAFAALTNRSMSQQVAAFSAEKDAALVAFVNRTVPQRARLITQTNQQEINRAISRAVIASGGADQIQIAAIAGGNFRESSLYRGNLIAGTEVQLSAESSKKIEADAYNANAENVRILKEWHTMGDERVREDHILANFQVRPLDAPYSVGGEALQYPSDPAGSAANTINCRCASVTFPEGM